MVSESSCSLALCPSQRRGELRCAADDSHPAPAAASRGFDQDWKADPLGLVEQPGRVLVIAVVTWDERHSVTLHQLLGLGLRPHRAHGGCRRADEHDPGRLAGLGKVRILR